MNGIKIPNFMSMEDLPKGYNDASNPYVFAQKSKYRLSAMVNYARKQGKKVPELTKEEADRFYLSKGFLMWSNTC